MLKLTELISSDVIDDTMTLPFEVRQKSRCLLKTDTGVDVGLFLSRGQFLRSGTVLIGADKVRVLVKAAPERVSVGRCNDPLMFARACYHLGNRHVPLQIVSGELRYLCDHVLDQMLDGLGLAVTHEQLPFEPEAGAYQHHDH